VRTARSRDTSDSQPDQGSGGKELAGEPDVNAGDIDLEGDMILGDLEAEITVDAQVTTVPSTSPPRFDACASSIRSDAEDIVTGGYFSHPVFNCSLTIKVAANPRSSKWHNEAKGFKSRSEHKCLEP